MSASQLTNYYLCGCEICSLYMPSVNYNRYGATSLFDSSFRYNGSDVFNWRECQTPVWSYKEVYATGCSLQKHTIIYNLFMNTEIIWLLTVTFSTWTEGRAEAYSRNITLIPIPITIPISSLRKRHDRNVAQAGIRSVSVTKN